MDYDNNEASATRTEFADTLHSNTDSSHTVLLQLAKKDTKNIDDSDEVVDSEQLDELAETHQQNQDEAANPCHTALQQASNNLDLSNAQQSNPDSSSRHAEHQTPENILKTNTHHDEEVEVKAEEDEEKLQNYLQEINDSSSSLSNATIKAKGALAKLQRALKDQESNIKDKTRACHELRNKLNTHNEIESTSFDTTHNESNTLNNLDFLYSQLEESKETLHKSLANNLEVKIKKLQGGVHQNPEKDLPKIVQEIQQDIDRTSELSNYIAALGQLRDMRIKHDRLSKEVRQKKDRFKMISDFLVDEKKHS